MREQVKAVALDLLIRHGYHGVTFADLAKPLKTTRANIHYHFGTKQALVEEVLDDYVRTSLEQLREVWVSPDVPLVQKIRRTAEHSRRRYLNYNPTGRTGHPWSLITRMRQDATALTAKSRALLRHYGSDLNAMIVHAIEEAKERGEFVSSMPVLDVGLHLVSIANSGGPITQDARSFDRLDHLYSSFVRIITLAFGPGRGHVLE